MMIRILHLLRSDERGVAAIELALIAPILAMMVMGAADVGSAFSRKLSLEQGVQRAVEKVMQTTELASVQDTIADEVALQAQVDEGQVTVDFTRYCAARPMVKVDEDDPDVACGAAERESLYILVNVTDEYDPMFGVGLGTKLPNGNYAVGAQAGMRTK